MFHRYAAAGEKSPLSQAMVNGKGSRGCAVVRGSLIKNMGQVIGYRLFTESQCLGNLTIALSLDDELEYLNLPSSQMRWEWSARCAMGLLRRGIYALACPAC